MSDYYVKLPPSGGGAGGVTSLNNQTGALTLLAGSNITITPGSGTLTISAQEPAIVSINGDTTAAQLLVTGTSGTDFTINTVAGTTTFAIPSASATARGLVTTGTQTFAGNKTFTGSISASNFSGSSSGTNTGDVTIGTANGLSIVGQVLSLGLSSTSTTGALSSTDWNTFNNKQSTLTLGNLTDAGTDGIVITGGTGAVVGSGTSIAQHVADTTHNGYLSSTDWNTFNGKQAAGNYITALTGDVTATGPGSVAATIAIGAVTDAKSSLSNKPAVALVATTNQTLSGFPVIDGVTPADGTMILLSAQSTGSENGPWVAHSGAWTRPTWYPSGGTTQAFQFITTFIRLGTTYQGSTWRQTAAGPITIDTTSTTWVVTPLALNSTTVATGFIPATLLPFTSLYIFGDGSDGNVTISSGTTTLTRDMYYNNLTMSGTGILNPASFKIFVKGTLDISAAAAGAIARVGNNASNAGSTGTGGNSGTNLVPGTLGSSGNSTNGSAGSATNGTNGSSGNGQSGGTNGGGGGLTGAGGTGTGGTAGAAGGGRPPALPNPIRRFDNSLVYGTMQIIGGVSGGGGGGGSGDGAVSGAGGGGGASGGGVLFISANIINRGASTPAATITVDGGTGGNGGTPASGNAGGGGGGAGGGGGWIYISYITLTGTTATNALSASGGAGGKGGNGSGTATGGGGSGSGAQGRITLIDLSVGTIAESVGATNTYNAGSANSGGTGGNGGASTTFRVSL